VMRMPGDGVCLFHSLAHGLNLLGWKESGWSVRDRIASFIQEAPEFEITGTPLKCWVDWDSKISVVGYAQKLYQGLLWGGAIEMAVCAHIFSVDLGVYEEDRYNAKLSRISDFNTGQKKPYGSVLLLYSGRSHYDALISDVPSTQHPSEMLSMQDSYRSDYSESSEWCTVM